MYTPEGLPAEGVDKIMLLAMWTRTLQQKRARETIISAGMGKPTFPINSQTIQSFLTYWTTIYNALNNITANTLNLAIDYGDPRGEKEALIKMADAMQKWYHTEVQPENILFTVGGAGALRIIFDAFNDLYKDIPHYRVLTPFPYYTLYADNRHKLHPIHILNEDGYRLTGKVLRASIREAEKLAANDNNEPRVLLLCNPNNPLGTVLSEQELLEIAEVLREYPKLNVVIDEAYAEMVWTGKNAPSIYELAPDLKERITVLRSATKALSAAGERMAMLMTFNPALKNDFLGKLIRMVGHPPRSSQIAYAETMAKFNEDDMDELEAFYKPKQDYVLKRLEEMQALMPDPNYKPDGTFYAMADLSDLFGMDIPLEAKKALGYGGKVQTSEELIYSLLFEDSMMIAPGQYFGLPPDQGYCRITCSGSEEELMKLMDRLDNRLFCQRLDKREKFITEIKTNLEQLQALGRPCYETMRAMLNNNSETMHPERVTPETQALLVSQNMQLKQLLSESRVEILRSSKEGKKEAIKSIEKFFEAYQKKRILKQEKMKLEKEWREFVNENCDGSLKNELLNRRPELRNEFRLWQERQAAKELDNEWKQFIDETITHPSVKDYFLHLPPEQRNGYTPWVDRQRKIQTDADGNSDTVIKSR